MYLWEKVFSRKAPFFHLESEVLQAVQSSWHGLWMTLCGSGSLWSAFRNLKPDVKKLTLFALVLGLYRWQLTLVRGARNCKWQWVANIAVVTHSPLQTLALSPASLTRTELSAAAFSTDWKCSEMLMTPSATFSLGSWFKARAAFLDLALSTFFLP